MWLPRNSSAAGQSPSVRWPRHGILERPRTDRGLAGNGPVPVTVLDQEIRNTDEEMLFRKDTVVVTQEVSYCFQTGLFLRSTKTTIHNQNNIFRKAALQVLENALHPLYRSLESLGTQIDALRSQVEQIKRSNSNKHADENYRSEPNPEVENQEQTAAADGLTVSKAPALHLRFLDSLETPVYTERKLTAEGDKAIKIAIFRDSQIITSGPLSSARIEVVALHGDFLYIVPDNWTGLDFTGRIVPEALGGVCQVKLKNGVASLSDICFKKVSSKTDSGKLIVAARVHRSDNGGLRVKEAVMDAVEVQILRNQVNEKSKCPKLKDQVHRLNGINRNGQPLKKLQDRGIYYVEDFLKAIYKDKENIRNECFNIKKDNKRWEATVKHAKECDLKGKDMLKLYMADEEYAELFFNCVHDLVGAKFDGRYIPNDNFSSAQQAKVNQLKKRAYDELAGIEFSYELKKDGPMPLSTTADIVIAGEAFFPLTGIAGPHPQGTGGIISVPGASEPILPELHSANGYEGNAGIGSTIYVPSASEPILLEPHNTNGYEGNTGIGTTIYGPSASEPNLLEPHSINGYEGNPASEQMVHEQVAVAVADVGGQLSDILLPEEAYGGDHCLGATQNTWDTDNLDGSFLELTDFENHGLSGKSWQWQDSNHFLGDNSMEASTSTQTNFMPGHPFH